MNAPFKQRCGERRYSGLDDRVAKRSVGQSDRKPSSRAKGHECFHCKEWVPSGTLHDCWTTTEQALTRDLPGDLRDAWERLRETAAAFGEQRIYASHSSIMFSRRTCYFFVRPTMKRLEVCVFLGRALKAPQVRKTVATSRAKVAHILHITHRDEVEPPLTDWLQEAYEVSPTLSGPGARKKPTPAAPTGTPRATKPRRSAARRRHP
jgi:hypothetical protein